MRVQTGLKLSQQKSQRQALDQLLVLACTVLAAGRTPPDCRWFPALNGGLFAALLSPPYFALHRLTSNNVKLINLENAMIDIHNITAYQQQTRVFDGFSLHIGAHERMAILGPNGAGKSTLLKLIDRELYPVQQDDSWLKL